MQTQTTQQPAGRLGRIPMMVSCAAAILLTWGPASIGGTGDIPAPAVLSATLTPAYSANQGLPGPGQGSSDAKGPLCAAAGAVDPWCTADHRVEGAPGEQSQEWVDVATFVEWHVQARHLAQYEYQTLTALSGPEGKALDRPTAVSAAAPVWITFAR